MIMMGKSIRHIWDILIIFLPSRCQHGKGRMAGVGSNCGKVKYSKSSCLSQGRIDVYKTKADLPKTNTCSYTEGITTGVLCCKRRKKSSSGMQTIRILNVWIDPRVTV